ncbi:hypothetical protein F4775DRAFT_451629 [Biscogniauxia sp. FL1348]|nr:hypothetical protein F4775DRAFT_451629 [Biscogniauxia sp. FL1348]
MSAYGRADHCAKWSSLYIFLFQKRLVLLVFACSEPCLSIRTFFHQTLMLQHPLQPRFHLPYSILSTGLSRGQGFGWLLDLDLFWPLVGSPLKPWFFRPLLHHMHTLSPTDPSHPPPH